MANGQTQGPELWIENLTSEKVQRVLPGYPMQDYTVSHDGKEVAFTMNDSAGHSKIWVAPTSRRSAPVCISSEAVEDSPYFLPNGDLIVRVQEDGSNFIYRMKSDGSARQKLSPDRMLDIYDVSPDGRWVAAGVAGSGDEERMTIGATRAIAVDGSPAATLCLGYCLIKWDTAGRFVYFRFPHSKQGTTFELPVMRDSGLPNIPPASATINDITSQKSITKVPLLVESAMNPSFYAYTKQNPRRNLYRIPLQ